jgi:multidrug efflux pump subunit AcrA (membrane-fusion protein)
MLRQKELLAHRMRIIAPFDGIIQELHIKKGEVVDPQKPAITIVNNSTLSVECYLPVLLANKLERQLNTARKANPNAELEVNVIIPDVPQPVAGKLTYFDPLADAGAGQRRVWVEIPNPDGLPAGMQVDVQIPQGGVAKAQANGQ